jgi:hypothetical protein
VVETGSQLVDDFARDDRQFRRQVGVNSDLVDEVARVIRVRLGSDTVWAEFAEGVQATFEITDVVLGPLDFLSDADESG